MREVTVVATQFDGVTKVVREGEMGFLVEPVSSTTWAEGYYGSYHFSQSKNDGCQWRKRAKFTVNEPVRF